MKQVQSKAYCGTDSAVPHDVSQFPVTPGGRMTVSAGRRDVRVLLTDPLKTDSSIWLGVDGGVDSLVFAPG